MIGEIRKVELYILGQSKTFLRQTTANQDAENSQLKKNKKK